MECPTSNRSSRRLSFFSLWRSISFLSDCVSPACSRQISSPSRGSSGQRHRPSAPRRTGLARWPRSRGCTSRSTSMRSGASARRGEGPPTSTRERLLHAFFPLFPCRLFWFPGCCRQITVDVETRARSFRGSSRAIRTRLLSRLQPFCDCPCVLVFRDHRPYAQCPIILWLLSGRSRTVLRHAATCHSVAPLNDVSFHRTYYSGCAIAPQPVFVSRTVLRRCRR